MIEDVVSLSNNLEWVDRMYDLYQQDPRSVSEDWRRLFAKGTLPPPFVATTYETDSNAGTMRSAWSMIHHFRHVGHLSASIDPLGLLDTVDVSHLDESSFGFLPNDRVFTHGVTGLAPEVSAAELWQHLHDTYCGNVGLEFLHVSSSEKVDWLAERSEGLVSAGMPDQSVRIGLLEKVIRAEMFERFIHNKYPGTKRFSLEGGESLVAMVDECFEHLARLGAIETVVGMAHRGRLNVLVQNMRKAPRFLFAEFDDVEPDKYIGRGDVKYHLGFSNDYVSRDGQEMHLSLSFNPSHLEAVNPVVVGRVRSKQRRHGDWARQRIAGILIHGDAAFAGQGLVPETFLLSNLRGYRTGGTIHLVVNNQIGFTATAAESRSTTYCTDVAKLLQCPIWHVNGDDPDRVAQVCQLAAEYRAQFQSDVVIDLLCYRKFGHNEMDEPKFTQPTMYRAIEAKTSVATLYGQTLVDEGVLSSDQIEEIKSGYKNYLQKELDAARARARRPTIPSMGGVWERYVGGRDRDVDDVDTGVNKKRLQEISEAMATTPDDLNVHRKVKKLLDDRVSMGSGKKPIDWGMGELLAYGSLLREGNHVRLSGQDSGRGTFSHRHSLIIDTESGREYMPLGHLHSEQGDCRIYDSPLSEAGVLGFEFGYSLDHPDGLVIWEAQFGDFVNGAQVIIDQFISSSEDKWHRLSGLVMLLPHGYEGQGPEHSSARIERFLQSAAEDNMQICQPSTPAQMFHLIRRQILRPYRKPLIVFTPKSLLRLPAARSNVDSFVNGQFKRFIADSSDLQPKDVSRIFLCSGRVYYDLLSERETRNDKRTAIVRVEQFYPWRPEQLLDILSEYTETKEWVWVQDEPINMGPAQFMIPRLQSILGTKTFRVESRVESASPATGSSKAHAIEQKSLIKRVFEGS